MKTKVTFFKPSGKYYTDEDVEIPDGTFAWDARAIIEEYKGDRLKDTYAVVMDGPWGYPVLIKPRVDGV